MAYQNIQKTWSDKCISPSNLHAGILKYKYYLYYIVVMRQIRLLD